MEGEILTQLSQIKGILFIIAIYLVLRDALSRKKE
jgi:hypothetical protein